MVHVEIAIVHGPFIYVKGVFPTQPLNTLDVLETSSLTCTSDVNPKQGYAFHLLHYVCPYAFI